MKKFQHKYLTMWEEGEIVVGVYEEVDIDLTIAKEIVEKRVQTFGQNRLFIIEAKGWISLTKEARDYFSSEEGCAGIKKSALIVNSPITRMVGNFIVKISKPYAPTKTFTSHEKARKWLMLD